MKEISELKLAAKKIRHVFFDLDGTIIKHDRSVSLASRDCIKKLKSAGITVSAATGRPLFSVRSLLNELGCNAASVTFSGALLSADKDWNCLNKFTFTSSQIKEVITFLKNINCSYEVYTDDNYYVPAINKLIEEHAKLLNKAPKVIPENEILQMNSGLIKVEALMEYNQKDSMQSLIRNNLCNFSCDFASAVATPEIFYCNIASVTEIRAKAFKIACEHLGLQPHEIIAIGDSDSDRTFIQKAGIGVAMGNSSETLKLEANLITDTIENEGFTKAFENLGLV